VHSLPAVSIRHADHGGCPDLRMTGDGILDRPEPVTQT
jgi:hypothetical protein